MGVPGFNMCGSVFLASNESAPPPVKDVSIAAASQCHINSSPAERFLLATLK